MKSRYDKPRKISKHWKKFKLVHPDEEKRVSNAEYQAMLKERSREKNRRGWCDAYIERGRHER